MANKKLIQISLIVFLIIESRERFNKLE